MPADAVLRETLRNSHGLTAEETAQISRTVFAYYRWLKWLSTGATMQARCTEAVRLASEFARNPGSFSDDALMKRTIPAWSTERLFATPAWARSLQSEPRIWLRARPGEAQRLAAELGHCRPPALPSLTDALEYNGPEDLFRTTAFHAGRFEIQDLHSQAVSVICAPKPNEKWWDACAGEGGKTLYLSDLMANSGLIWASDRAGWRLEKLKKRAARAKVFNYRTAPWPGNSHLPTKTLFDGVLVDAPCSGVGTWHRNPHARWTTQPTDISELAELQQQLLAFASKAVKPRGKLIYAVCTITRDETDAVADAFEKRAPGFVPFTFLNPLTGREEPSGRATLRTEDTGGNGMYVAAWRSPPSSTL
jgi:16S rRNA (cytosine967-C5)-methyltransferase